MSNSIKITAISDLHGNLIKNIEPCDILLIAGDVCPATNHNALYQVSWLNKEFNDWLGTIPAEHIVGVAGNHDWAFEKYPENVNIPNWHYLIDDSIILEGLKIYGTPWQPNFCNWAFNLGEMELSHKFSKIPDDIDILISHGPPMGFGDVVMEDIGPLFTEHLGSYALTENIKRAMPKLVVFGHIHTGSHIPRVYPNDNKECVINNVSILDEKYQIAYKPFTYIIERK